MTSRKAQAPSGDESVVYVYGVTRAKRWRASAALLAGIVAEAPVRPLAQGNLMAFVSTVPKSQFGADEFRSALSDAKWLKDRILAHQHVLAELQSCFDVVPFRFGTIYLDTAQASHALTRHSAQLCRAFDRIRGADEWGLKLYCDAPALRRRIECKSAAIRLLRAALAHAAPGAGFFLQKKLASAFDGETAAAVAGCVQHTHRRLAVCAREFAEIDVQPPGAHGRAADMVTNAACLIAKASVPQFRRTIARLQKQYAARGFDYELTGPWPPYHFVSIRHEVADAAQPDR